MGTSSSLCSLLQMPDASGACDQVCVGLPSRAQTAGTVDPPVNVADQLLSVRTDCYLHALPRAKCGQIDHQRWRVDDGHFINLGW
jgi:hypothetical protein